MYTDCIRGNPFNLCKSVSFFLGKSIRRDISSKSVVIKMRVKRKNRYLVKLPLVSRANRTFFISRSS
jgi:hypothetical protein